MLPRASNTPDLDPTPAQSRIAQQILGELNQSNGLAPVDLDRFWSEQAIAGKNPFGRDIPQCPMGIMMSGECVFDELGIAADYRRYNDDENWRLELNRAYNERSLKIVGRKLLGEKPGDPRLRRPSHKSLADIFEAKQVWHDWSWWLQPSADTPEQLAALLDRVDRRLENLREFVLPADWDEKKASFVAAGGRSPLYRGQRGPCTFACSVFGVENMLMLCLDDPDLSGRFRDAILRAMLGLARVLDEEAGFTPATAPRGFSFLDDNCCLFSPEMYAHFGAPILKGIWDVYSPQPGQHRYQHSDSPMAHLLPQLGELKLTGVNFGPTVTVSEIRKHLPGAEIHGQLAPFTFSNNDHEAIVLEFLRDFEQAGDSRGLVFTTAGSINNGSRLTSMRLVMSTIQRFGRYA